MILLQSDAKDELIDKYNMDHLKNKEETQKINKIEKWTEADA